ncbi:MAG: hypothetical protein ACKOHG_18050, partial [Planctomycetia bacterium]
YVMLAELVKFGSDSGGLGDLINVSQRRGEREPILIVLVIIPLVAYAIDRCLVAHAALSRGPSNPCSRPRQSRGSRPRPP